MQHFLYYINVFFYEINRNRVLQTLSYFQNSQPYFVFIPLFLKIIKLYFQLNSLKKFQYLLSFLFN